MGKRIRLFLSLILCCIVFSPLTARTISREGKPYPLSVIIPEEVETRAPEKRQYSDTDIDLAFYAQTFSQGDAVYWELVPQKKDVHFSFISLTADGKECLASAHKWGYRGFFAINPDTKPGDIRIVVRFKTGEREQIVDISLRVHDAEFLFARTPLDLGKYSDVDYQETPENRELIRICSEKKKKAFGSMGPDLVTSHFAHPRDRHYITSQFWSKRVYMQYRFLKKKKVHLPNRIKTHAGIDLRGGTGEPIFAMADGTINLAEPLFYEGNMIIIDHGNRFFSYYMHMDGVMVKTGDRVRAGEQIGRVGSTGVSTASHLHVSCIIDGVQVNPLSILFLPVRD